MNANVNATHRNESAKSEERNFGWCRRLLCQQTPATIAVLEWPLGKLVVSGIRNLCGRSSWTTGRSRLN